jgi:hypothetical protein
MSYIYTRKHHKEENSGWGRSFRKSSVRGRNPKDKSVRGSNLDGNLPLPLMSEGERFIICINRELDSWRESTKACFQRERWSQGEHGKYEFNVTLVCFHQFQRERLLINWVSFH